MTYQIILDIGHGGRDPGSIGLTTYEKNNNLALGLKIGKILQRHGLTVNFTRAEDKDFCDGDFSVNLDLQNRIAISKTYNPDVFLSLHNNSFNQQVKGIETWCYKFSGSDEALATCIQNQMINDLGMIDRGVKASGNKIYVLKKFDGTKTDACLVEYGFIDSEEDVILSKMDIASVAISKGILEHLGIQFIEENNNGDEDMLETAVLLYSKDDYFAGGDVAQKYNCAIFIRPNDKSCPKEAFSAKQLIIVGGGSVRHPNEILLSGNTKFDTCTAVGKFLG